MQVLLKKDIPNLGQSGDIKKVKAGYARNYLIPNDLVVRADAKNKKEQLFLEQMQSRKKEKRKKEAKETLESIDGISISITPKLGEGGKLFGSVTNLHIRNVLAEKGFDVDKRNIQLDSPIKTLGIFNIPIKLYKGVSCSISLIVQDEEGNTEIKSEKEDVPEVETDQADTNKKEDAPEVETDQADTNKKEDIEKTPSENSQETENASSAETKPDSSKEETVDTASKTETESEKPAKVKSSASKEEDIPSKGNSSDEPA